MSKTIDCKSQSLSFSYANVQFESESYSVSPGSYTGYK